MHLAWLCRAALQWVEWALPTRIPGVSLQHTPAQHLHRFITHKISEFQESVARRAAARAADPRSDQGLSWPVQQATVHLQAARRAHPLLMAFSHKQSQHLPDPGCWLPVPHLDS